MAKATQIQVKVRMSKDLHRRLQREAAQRGQTLNAEILRRLEDSFEFAEALNSLEKSLLKIQDNWVGIKVELIKRMEIIKRMEETIAKASKQGQSDGEKE